MLERRRRHYHRLIRRRRWYLLKRTWKHLRMISSRSLRLPNASMMGMTNMIVENMKPCLVTLPRLQQKLWNSTTIRRVPTLCFGSPCSAGVICSPVLWPSTPTSKPPENNPPSQLFFSETLKVYRQPTRILNCLIMDKRSTGIRTGCAHCPTHICGTTFYHPPMGNSEYGEDEEKDHARFDYDESTSSSDDEE
ncbi:unnamed protein product [Linum tenue]|uniref:Uncharacterized protein n=1 Tax=Linum tenue TaxID=586396 RepID=A0AAV0M4M4_9ROSI|nr:unnamed protein product [Linum tenue]